MTSRLIAGPGLVLEGPELLAVNWLVTHGVQALRQRDGVALPAHVRDLALHIDLAASLARQAMSAPGHRVADIAPGDASSEVQASGGVLAGGPGRLSSRQVAAALGLSVRHVTRIAGVLGGVKTGQDWSFDQEAVTAYGAEREE